MARGKKGPRDLSKKTVPQLLNTLDEIFAMWVKLNWSPDGCYVECYTCGRPLRIGDQNCQAGHWISRTYSPVRYDENNVRPQGSECNDKRYGNGKPVEFERNLRLEVGDDVVDELKERALQPWKWDRSSLQEKIVYYRNEVKAMEGA